MVETNDAFSSNTVTRSLFQVEFIFAVLFQNDTTGEHEHGTPNE